MDVARRMRRALGISASTALAFGALAAAAPAANAAFSLSGLGSAPASTAAGAHSDFTIQVSFPDSGSNVKNLTVGLPPGQIGDPTATPLCKVAELNHDSCPAASQVGTVSTAVTITVVALPVSTTVDGSIYNLIPQAGEPARFGIVLRPVSLPSPLPSALPPITLQSAVQLRPDDFGLNTVISNIPDTTTVPVLGTLPTHIDSMTVQLDGLAGSPLKPFMRNPTSCSLATTNFSAGSYDSQTATGQASYTPTACGGLPFSPTFTASIGAPGKTAPPAKPPLTTVVDQDAGEAGVENVSVVLPAGVAANNDQLGNSCPAAQFTSGSCPAKSIVGSAKATSPLLTQALSGPVTVVAPASPGSLPRLGLDLQGQLHIQLFGEFTLSADGPGNAFNGIPDIPLSHFALNFAADKLVGIQRDLCDAPVPTFATSFTGWNGAVQTGDVAAAVKGCGSGGGKPKAKVKISHPKSKKPRLKLTVKDGAAKIVKTKLKLPTKLRFAKGPAAGRGFTVRGGGSGIATASIGSRSVSVKTGGVAPRSSSRRRRRAPSSARARSPARSSSSSSRSRMTPARPRT